MEYEFQITETYLYNVKIEAESKEEAFKIIDNIYEDPYKYGYEFSADALSYDDTKIELVDKK